MWEAGGNSPAWSRPGQGTMAASRGKRQGKKHREKAPVRGMQSSGSDAWGWGATQTSQGSLRPSATGTETQRRAGHQPAAGSARASYHPQQKQRVPPAPGEMPGAQKAAVPPKTILGQSSWHRLAPYTTLCMPQVSPCSSPLPSPCRTGWQDTARAYQQAERAAGNPPLAGEAAAECREVPQCWVSQSPRASPRDRS